MKRLVVGFFFVAAFCLSTAGCGVKPWARGRLASAPMQLQPGLTTRFEQNAESYREGAAGANGGKSGGGCGCS